MAAALAEIMQDRTIYNDTTAQVNLSIEKSVSVSNLHIWSAMTRIGVYWPLFYITVVSYKRVWLMVTPKILT
jgi:hypothetical protein